MDGGPDLPTDRGARGRTHPALRRLGAKILNVTGPHESSAQEVGSTLQPQTSSQKTKIVRVQERTVFQTGHGAVEWSPREKRTRWNLGLLSRRTGGRWLGPEDAEPGPRSAPTASTAGGCGRLIRRRWLQGMLGHEPLPGHLHPAHRFWTRVDWSGVSGVCPSPGQQGLETEKQPCN